MLPSGHATRRLPLVLAGVMSMIALTAAPSLARRPADGSATGSSVGYTYVIGPADVLEIAVWNNEPMSRTVPVRPDGKISLPVLNDVQAAGLTPLQLQDVLTKALGAYLRTPQVSVIVREVHSFKVSVIGEVKTPGRYELTSRATVLDVLAMAGGLGEYADRDRIVVLRRDGTGTREIPFAYDDVVPSHGSKSQTDFFVEPDDIILVR